ncbi:aspartate aminotransferase family protein [Aminithiophilus ramosus]|uniref:Aspartate aminotransferase family protein n=2 Tax=Synergistales TaxID=649776 RepID=A0A9Q7ASU2_9BACT|nr:aspartate aminotransferase family protein [Aminithiophilus ramosus]QTX33306.1 aspartate aminotransferase family protein [Aminithiophilus ramosus]QVL36946.1 aspartate aminotransferase family protein [Synergistota bacterium]
MDWKALAAYTDKPIARSGEIIEREERVLPKAVAIKYFPMAIERGRGSLVWDADGNRYIDFLTSAAVYNVGHGHPAVVEAVREQVGKLQNYTIVYFYNDRPVRLAERLIETTPGTFAKKAAFAFSGSDGVDGAIRAARSFTGRRQVLCFKNAYHGMTTISLSVTAIVGREIRERVCPDRNVVFLEYPDPYRNSWGIDGYGDPEALTEAAMKEVEEALARHRGDVAALLIEPAQGDGGMIFPPRPFMRRLREVTEREGVVFIDEEVQTGMGRSGRWWAIEHDDVVPDLIVSAKALGGGLPISAIVGRADILDDLPSPLLAYTHTGHAVSCAAAEATLSVIRDEKLTEKAEEKGRRLADWFRRRAERFPFIGDIRQRGLLMGVEIVSDREKKSPDKAMALKISWAAWERGLLLITFGRDGNVLRLAPPLNISEELFLEALDRLEGALDDASSGRVPDGILTHLQGW